MKLITLPLSKGIERSGYLTKMFIVLLCMMSLMRLNAQNCDPAQTGPTTVTCPADIGEINGKEVLGDGSLLTQIWNDAIDNNDFLQTFSAVDSTALPMNPNASDLVTTDIPELGFDDSEYDGDTDEPEFFYSSNNGRDAAQQDGYLIFPACIAPGAMVNFRLGGNSRMESSALYMGNSILAMSFLGTSTLAATPTYSYQIPLDAPTFTNSCGVAYAYQRVRLYVVDPSAFGNSRVFWDINGSFEQVDAKYLSSDLNSITEVDYCRSAIRFGSPDTLAGIGGLFEESLFAPHCEAFTVTMPDAYDCECDFATANDIVIDWVASGFDFTQTDQTITTQGKDFDISFMGDANIKNISNNVGFNYTNLPAGCNKFSMTIVPTSGAMANINFKIFDVDSGEGVNITGYSNGQAVKPFVKLLSQKSVVRINKNPAACLNVDNQGVFLESRTRKNLPAGDRVNFEVYFNGSVDSLVFEATQAEGNFRGHSWWLSDFKSCCAPDIPAGCAANEEVRGNVIAWDPVTMGAMSGTGSLGATGFSIATTGDLSLKRGKGTGASFAFNECDPDTELDPGKGGFMLINNPAGASNGTVVITPTSGTLVNPVLYFRALSSNTTITLPGSCLHLLKERGGAELLGSQLSDNGGMQSYSVVQLIGTFNASNPIVLDLTKAGGGIDRFRLAVGELECMSTAPGGVEACAPSVELPTCSGGELPTVAMATFERTTNTSGSGSYVSTEGETIGFTYNLSGNANFNQQSGSNAAYSFSNPTSYTPVAGSGGFLGISTQGANNNLTITFDEPVTDPLIYIKNNYSSILDFSGTTLENGNPVCCVPRVSGTTDFSVVGSSAQDMNGIAMGQSDGIVQLIGTFTSITVSMSSTGRENFRFSIGDPISTECKPEPVCQPVEPNCSGPNTSSVVTHLASFDTRNSPTSASGEYPTGGEPDPNVVNIGTSGVEIGNISSNRGPAVFSNDPFCYKPKMGGYVTIKNKQGGNKNITLSFANAVSNPVIYIKGIVRVGLDFSGTTQEDGRPLRCLEEICGDGDFEVDDVAMTVQDANPTATGRPLNQANGIVQLLGDYTTITISIDDLGGGKISDNFRIGVGDLACGPTPVPHNSLAVSKELTNVVAPSTACEEAGTVLATYQITVTNNSSETLTDVSVEDHFEAEVLELGAILGITSGPSIVSGPGLGVNANFDGLDETELLDGSGSLAAGATVIVEFTVEVDPSLLPGDECLLNNVFGSGFFVAPSGETCPVTGSSEAENAGGAAPICNWYPSIASTKMITNIVEAPCDQPGMIDVTYEIKMQNVGNISLTNLQVNDPLATLLGAALIEVVSPPAITASDADTDPSLGSFTGQPGGMDFLAGNDGMLAQNQVITFSTTVRVNPNAVCGALLNNQATVTGMATQGALTPMMAMDLTDDGDDPLTGNPSFVGHDSSSDDCHDDMTPLMLPSIASSLEMLEFQCSPDSCGAPGEVVAMFEIRIENIGNTDLLDVQSTIDLGSQLGAGFVEVLPTTLRILPASTYKSKGTLNSSFDASSDPNMFVGSTSSLRPCDQLILRFQAVINPTATGSPAALMAQGSVSATGFDANRSIIVMDPATNAPLVVMDLTDEGNMPESTNAGSLNDSGCEDDPTILPIPYLETLPTDLEIDVDGDWQTALQNWLDNLSGAVVNTSNVPVGSVVMNSFCPLKLYPLCGPNSAYGPGGISGVAPGFENGQTFQFMFMDDNGNSMCFCATVRLIDNNAPVWNSMPSDLTIDCSNPNAQSMLQDWLDNGGFGEAVDYGSDVTITNDFSGTMPGSCNGSQTITFTASDNCGFSSTATADLTINDNSAPTLELTHPMLVGLSDGDELVLNCGDLAGMNLDATAATATDDCSTATITISDTPINSDCSVTGLTYGVARTWIATDGCGNSTSITIMLKEMDNEAPTFSNVPADVTIDCPDTPSFGTPTVSDDCTDAASISVTFVDTNSGGSCPDGYTVTRTWTATDACGKTSTATSSVTVRGNMPTGSIVFIVIPPNANVSCSQGVNFGTAQATTNCPTGGLQITFNDTTTPGSCANNYVATRTWTATDACGSQETASQSITVSDNTAPVFGTFNTNVTINCGDPMNFPAPSATDDCGNVTMSFQDLGQSGDCQTGFVNSRIWTATDDCGNTSTAMQTVTTTPDNTPPTVTVHPANQYFTCGQAWSFDQPQAIDNCSNVTWSYRDSIVGDTTCASGNSADIYRTWTATDDCGNAVSINVVAWLFNPTGPIMQFAYIPANSHIECGENVEFGVPECFSGCGDVTITHTDSYVADCVTGDRYTRVWLATDDCGNSQMASQTITVTPDTQAPVITVGKGPHYISCNETPVFATPVVTDNCSTGLSITLTYEDRVEMNGCGDSYYIRAWSAEDPCGNKAIEEQIIPIEDRIAPVFTSDNEQLNMNHADYLAASFTPQASDDCSDVTIEEVSREWQGECANTSVVITHSAADDCGNVAIHTTTVNIEDAEMQILHTTQVPVEMTNGEQVNLAVNIVGGIAPIQDNWSLDPVAEANGWSIDYTNHGINLHAGTGNAVLTMIYTSSNGCVITKHYDIVQSTVISSISETNITGVEILIYPVPTLTTLYLKANSTFTTDVQARIISATGGETMAVETFSIHAGKSYHDFDITSLPVGNYFLELNAGEHGKAIRSFQKVD